MDKFTSLANKFLKETFESSQRIIEEGMIMKVKSLAMQGLNTDDIIDELDIEDNKDARVAIDYIVNHVKKDKNEFEDAENAFISPDDEKALEVATKLSTRARGGLNPFDSPQRNIDIALGRMYNKIAKKVSKIAKEV